MKFKKYFFVVLIFSLTVIYFSCDDSGTNPFAIHRGTISLKLYNLKPLNKNVDGLYEAWLRFDTSATFNYYYSLGLFNVAADGSPVDSNGQPLAFKYNGDTTKLFQVTHCLVTVEDRNRTGYFGYGPCLLDVVLNRYADSLSGKLTIGGPQALDSVGRALLSFPGGGYYTLMSLTSNNPAQDCGKGIWLCGVTGDSALLSLGKLPSNSQWIYEGWVADTLTTNGPYYYSIGRFSDPRHADLDGAGGCAGPNTANAYDKPGQEWIQNGCPGGKPTIANLSAGYYQVFVTIEPVNKPSGSTPFPFQLLRQGLIIVGCDRVDNLFNPQNQNGGQYPYGTFYIKY